MKSLVQFKIENKTLLEFDSLIKNRTRSQAIRDMIEAYVDKKTKEAGK